MRRAPRGFSLIEALAAATLVGFALLVGLAVVFWADDVERRAARRIAAVELAGSIAERVRAAPYETLASGEIDLSGEILADLPDASVILAVEEDEDLRLKHVVIVVAWSGEMAGHLQVETSVGMAGLYAP